MKQQVTYKFLHVGDAVEGEDQHDLLCRKCYPPQDQPKHEAFDQFWGIIEHLELNFGGYSEQIIYAFNKLSELSFDKGKPYNPLLIAGIRAILITLEYDAEPEVNITTGIF